MAACLPNAEQRKPSLRFSLRLALFVKKTAPVRARVCAVWRIHVARGLVGDASAQRYLTTSRRAEQINFRLWAASAGGLVHFKPSVRCCLLALSVNSNSCLEWSLLGA